MSWIIRTRKEIFLFLFFYDVLEAVMLTKFLDRFSPLICSTPPRLLRPRSTSSRYVFYLVILLFYHSCHVSHGLCWVAGANQIIFFLSNADPCAQPPILLHGRQVPRLLHDHHRFLTRPDRRHLPGLHHGPVSADGRQGSINRGLLFPEKVED